VDTFLEQLFRLSHSNIAQLYDCGVINTEQPYLIMEHIKGEELGDFIANNHLTLDKRLELFERIASAVQHAHEHQIIHRDIKPSNIIVTKNGTPKLLDFGIAKEQSKKPQKEESFSPHTVRYASPEQLLSKVVSYRSDIYQLGYLLNFIITSTHLISGNTKTEVIKYVTQNSELKKASQLLKENSKAIPNRLLEGEIDAIILKCLNKQVDQRYPTVDALLKDIKNFQYHYPVQAFSGGWFYSARKNITRNKLGYLFLMVFIITIGVAVSTHLNTIRSASEVERNLRHEAQRAQLVAERKEKFANKINRVLKDTITSLYPKDSLLMKEDARYKLLSEIKDRALTELGQENEKLPDILNMIGKAEYSLGNFNNATILFKQALSNNLDVSTQLNIKANLARTYVARNEFLLAEPLYKGVLEQSDRMQPDEVLLTRILYASLLGRIKKTNEAKQQLEIVTQKLDQNRMAHRDLFLRVHRVYGEIENNAHNYNEAIIHFNNYLKVSGNEDSQMLIHIYNGLGIAYNNLKDFELALDSYQNAFRLAQKYLPEKHGDYAIMLMNLGTANYRLSYYDVAEQQVNRAMELCMNVYGKNSKVAKVFQRVANQFKKIKLKYNIYDAID
jgi:eukaryotic-like serine/threonine-protein kinase